MLRRRLKSLNRWDRWYVLVSAGLALFVAGYLVNGRRSGDVYWHVAVIERFAADPWSPANPMVATDDPDFGLSPYLLLIGLVSRITGLTGFEVLDLAGLALVVVFAVLFRRAVLVLTGEPDAPVIALVLTLVAWGIGPWRWSGYLSLNSIGFMTGYPSMAAWCALLGAVIAAERLVRDPRWAWSSVLAVLMAFLTLTHPITLVGAGPLTFGVVLRSRSRTAVLALLAASALALAAVVLWPYYSAVDLLATGGAYDESNRSTYRNLMARSVLALPGLTALAWRVRRSRLDPLVLTGAFAGTVLVVGHLTERWTAGRALPFLLLAAHVALATWIARRVRLPGPGSVKRVVVAGTAVLVVAGVVGTLPGIAAAIPRDLLPRPLREDERLESEMDRYGFLASHLDDDDVVATTEVGLARAVPAYGASVVVPGYPAPHVDDIVRRRSDSSILLRGERPEHRRIVERYGVTHVLVRSGSTVPADGFELLASDDHYELYARR